jgi:hypothetical protein
MNKFFTIVTIIIWASSAQAADFYIAQSSAGGNTGADCADAYAVTFFNTASNWSNPKTVGKIGPGDTVHLCGTITSQLIIGASGSSGSVITIHWEPGATVSIPSGYIFYNIPEQSYLLFDGGTPCGPGTNCDAVEQSHLMGYASGQTGIAENTANGSGLANQGANSVFLWGNSGLNNIEIRNLIIRNLYIHSSMTDTTGNIDSGTSILQCKPCTGNILIHDNSIHDLGNAISLETFNNSPTVSIYNNDMFRNNWAIENSGNGARTLNIYNNHFHDANNWDTNNDTFHHNALHNYMNAGATDSIGLNFYNNTSDGDWGSCCTTDTLIFTEVTKIANFNVFNNVDIQSCNTNYAPSIQYEATSGGMYNNTFIGCKTTSGDSKAVQVGGSGFSFENNVIQGYGQYIVVESGVTFSNISNNAYGPLGANGNPPWVCGATGANTLSAWKTACGEASPVYNTSSLGMNSSGMPQVGSPLINTGINLTSINITALDSDYLGNARPASGVWDIGAYEPVAPMPPTLLRIN